MHKKKDLVQYDIISDLLGLLENSSKFNNMGRLTLHIPDHILCKGRCTQLPAHTIVHFASQPVVAV